MKLKMQLIEMNKIIVFPKEHEQKLKTKINQKLLAKERRLKRNRDKQNRTFQNNGKNSTSLQGENARRYTNNRMTKKQKDLPMTIDA